MGAVTWIGVAVATAVLDVLWARYIVACAAHQSVRAGLYSAGTFLISGTVVMSYIHDPKLIIPAAVGAFAGTAIGVRKCKS